MHSLMPAKLEGKSQLVVRIACPLLPLAKTCQLSSPRRYLLSRACVHVSQASLNSGQLVLAASVLSRRTSAELSAECRTPKVKSIKKRERCRNLFANYLHQKVREHPGTAVNRVLRGIRKTPHASANSYSLTFPSWSHFVH